MNIVFRHPCQLPVKKYGGTERIIYWLMQAMVKLGHRVTFIGKAGSDLSGDGVQFFNEDSVEDWRSLIPKDTDIIHLNYPPNEELDFPVVFTLHGNAKSEEIFPENTICISAKQAQNHNADFFIHNPVNFNEYPESFCLKKTSLSRLLFLAKASWSVKNLKHSLKVARKLKCKIDVVGGKTWIPRLGVTSHGFLGGKEKLDVMSKCDALIFPVRWHEPFGIAIVEAMALGMPVFGSKYGSLPEMVVQGCGAVFNSHIELIETLKNSKWDYDNRFIRQSAIERFDHTQQAEKYIQAYERIIAGEKLNSKKVQRNMNLNPEGLLDF